MHSLQDSVYLPQQNET
ncbi:unnamed protein product [Victoria cruziana]